MSFVINFDIACMICLKSESKSYRSIYEHDEESKTKIWEKINYCSDMQLQPESYNPTEKICFLCCADLSAAWRFKHHCNVANAIFETIKRQEDEDAALTTLELQQQDIKLPTGLKIKKVVPKTKAVLLAVNVGELQQTKTESEPPNETDASDVNYKTSTNIKNHHQQQKHHQLNKSNANAIVSNIIAAAENDDDEELENYVSEIKDEDDTEDLEILEDDEQYNCIDYYEQEEILDSEEKYENFGDKQEYVTIQIQDVKEEGEAVDEEEVEDVEIDNNDNYANIELTTKCETPPFNASKIQIPKGEKQKAAKTDDEQKNNNNKNFKTQTSVVRADVDFTPPFKRGRGRPRKTTLPQDDNASPARKRKVFYNKTHKSTGDIINTASTASSPTTTIKQLPNNRKSTAPTGVGDEQRPQKICDICGNSYKYQHALISHMRRHTNDRPFLCEFCTKGFVSAVELRRHMRVHTGHKPYSCKFCERRFADFGSRIKHERTHTGERPYECATCGKRFAYAHVLSVHVRTHTGEKKYRCTICEKGFTKKAYLTSHMNQHANLKKFSSTLVTPIATPQIIKSQQQQKAHQEINNDDDGDNHKDFILEECVITTNFLTSNEDC